MDYLKILAEEIHSVVLATVDNEGKPATRVIDIMHYDEDSVYFLTSNQKQMYKQLIERPFVSITGIFGGKDTLSKKMITLQGEVECIGKEKLEILLVKNPYMFDIYPTPQSQQVLEVFKVKKAIGEMYDLTVLPPQSFAFEIGSDKE